MTRVDEGRGAVHTSARLPADGSLEGRMLYFVNDAYSRTTAYQLERLEAAPEGGVLYFGDTSFILGRGGVAGVSDEHTMLSSIPHEYACPLGGRDSKFFDGKLVTNERGAATHLTSVEFGNPTTLRVESTEGFSPGDTLYYHDLQPGDRLVLPTTTSLSSQIRAGHAY